ncbi:MAG TPA: GNAT family N-acetyltransferase [Chloroflexia bacterium]|nr:GNAT family N-acetyltransferase [Chloroflexia bacterium]
MQIRALTEADAAIYQALRLRSLQDAPEAFGKSYEEEAGRRLDEVTKVLTANGSDNITLGAFDEGGTLVGIVNLQRYQLIKMRHKAAIGGMFVASEARGQGVGKALMERALELGREMEGIEQISLWVSGNNPAARGLYAACGFEYCGGEPRGLKLGNRYVDLELMVLRLD